MKRLILLLVTVAAVLFWVSQGLADSWSDDFSTDTTGNYQALYMPYYGASATASILYDAPNEQAIVQGVGGYGHIVMEKNGEVPIAVGDNFTFSADATVLSEYNAYIYLGDNLPIWGTGTNAVFRIGTFADLLHLEIDQNGQTLSDLTTPYTPHSGNLSVSRNNGEYSFYCNNNLIWQEAIPTLDGMPLYYGVGDEISSGPSGVTAQSAFDNLSFASSPTPEPSTLVLLGVGAISLLGCAWRRWRRAA